MAFPKTYKVGMKSSDGIFLDFFLKIDGRNEAYIVEIALCSSISHFYSLLGTLCAICVSILQKRDLKSYEWLPIFFETICDIEIVSFECILFLLFFFYLEQTVFVVAFITLKVTISFGISLVFAK